MFTEDQEDRDLPRVVFVRHPEVRDENDPVLADAWKSKLEIVVWLVGVISVVLAWMGLRRLQDPVEAALMAALGGIVQVTCWSFLLGVTGKPASTHVRRTQAWLVCGAALSTGLLCSVFAWYALAFRPSTIMHFGHTIEDIAADLRRLNGRVTFERQALPIIRDGAEMLEAEARKESDFGGVSGHSQKGVVYSALTGEARRFVASAELVADGVRRSEELQEESRRLLGQMRALLVDVRSGNTDMDLAEAGRVFAGQLARMDEMFGELGHSALPTALRMIDSDVDARPVASDGSKLPPETQVAALAEVRRMTDGARRRVEGLVAEARSVRTRQYRMLTDEEVLVTYLPHLPMYLAAPLIADIGVPVVMMLIMFILRAGLRREAREEAMKRAEREAAEAEALRVNKGQDARHVRRNVSPARTATIELPETQAKKGDARVSPLFAALRASKSAPRH